MTTHDDVEKRLNEIQAWVDENSRGDVPAASANRHISYLIGQVQETRRMSNKRAAIIRRIYEYADHLDEYFEAEDQVDAGDVVKDLHQRLDGI